MCENAKKGEATGLIIWGQMVVRIVAPLPVTAPGFPVEGGVDLVVGGVWTPEVVTFRKFCMSKRKNMDPWGVCAGHAP